MSPEQQPPEAAAGDDRTARIVRYPNRRLYDRAQGRYVTLQEIVAMIREGKAITVRDSKTGEDLTGTILTQILLEFHPERVDVFPVPVLHLLIRANDIVLAFLREYLRQSLTYLEFWQRAASFGSLATPWEWLKSFMPSGPAQPAGEPSPAATPPPAPPPPTGTEALARRVEELERRLSALGAPPEKDEAGAPDAAGSPARRKDRPAGRSAGRRSRAAPTARGQGAEQPKPAG